MKMLQKTSKMQQKRKQKQKTNKLYVNDVFWALTATVEPFLPLPPVIKIWPNEMRLFENPIRKDKLNIKFQFPKSGICQLMDGKLG